MAAKKRESMKHQTAILTLLAVFTFPLTALADDPKPADDKPLNIFTQGLAADSFPTDIPGYYQLCEEFARRNEIQARIAAFEVLQKATLKSQARKVVLDMYRAARTEYNRDCPEKYSPATGSAVLADIVLKMTCALEHTDKRYQFFDQMACAAAEALVADVEAMHYYPDAKPITKTAKR